MEDDSTTSICKICNEEKSLDNYYKRKSSKNNHQPICKICSYELLKEYIKNNEEHHKSYIKKYQREHYHKVKENREKCTCECGKSVDLNHLSKHIETDFHKRKINNVKKCTTCKLEKSLDKFYNCNVTYDKLFYSCKECVCIISRNRRHRIKNLS